MRITHYRQAVDAFEILYNMVKHTLIERDRASLEYYILYLKLRPEYGELQEPETT